MPDEPFNIAVHYFYLLKEDESDQLKLWSLLAGGQPQLPEPSLSLGLTEPSGELPGECRIVHRSNGAEADYCLMFLSDLTVIETIYKSGGKGSIEELWQDALSRVQGDRDRAGAENINIFSETTVLLGPGSLGERPVTAAALPSGRVLSSNLSTETGAAGTLVHTVGHGQRGRDFYLLASDHPEDYLSTTFPRMDSLIKKLKRVSSHFGEQRRTIIEQRAEIDSQVGALLHQQVIAGGSEASSAAQLEKRIASLSRMFGILATDSLLVRQAGDRLEKETGSLAEAFASTFSRAPESRDEIGDYYMGTFNNGLGEVQTETGHLDFSRMNAQAAIEVVRTQVELLRAGEEAVIQEQTRELLSRSLVLQKERLALQVAAVFVEFVLVFYYVLKSWEGIVGQEAVEHLSPALRALLVGGFSASAAFGTHFLAQTLQSRNWKNLGLWISIAVLVSSFAAMVMLTVSQN